MSVCCVQQQEANKPTNKIEGNESQNKSTNGAGASVRVHNVSEFSKFVVVEVFTSKLEEQC